MAKRVEKLKINETTMILTPTQWGKRILPFVFPQGKFGGSGQTNRKTRNEQSGFRCRVPSGRY
jgi:hypothetical protein